MVSIPLPPKALIGMVHVGALPGTPRASQTVDELVRADALTGLERSA
jgi:predicted TIM-barrel enzyme